MTQAEFDNVVNYLADPCRETLIEAELHPSFQIHFENLYSILTNNYPLPSTTATSPYYVWQQNANKYSIELRLYFKSDINMPQVLIPWCRNNTRPGYIQFDNRINNNDFIYNLFSRGFVLGNQIAGRIP